MSATAPTAGAAQSHPPTVVTAAVLVREGKVLVCQRAMDGSHAGKWEFPGGKLEIGESLEECMQRELREELGIDAVVGLCVWRTLHTYPGRTPVELHFFAIPQHRGEIINRIFARVTWVAIPELADVDFLDGDREFMAALMAGAVGLG